MAGKSSINWKLIAGKILPATAIVSALGVGGSYVVPAFYRDVIAERPERPRLDYYSTLPNDAGTYRLSGPGQFMAVQGDFTYTFNYHALQVLIKSDKDVDPIDFKNFSNPAMIEEMRGKGCAMGKSFVTAAAQFLTDHEKDDNLDEWQRNAVNSDRTTAQSFVDTYCKPQR